MVCTLCAHGETEMGSEHDSGVLRDENRPTLEYETSEFSDIRIKSSLLQYLRDLAGTTFLRESALPRGFIRSGPSGRHNEPDTGVRSVSSVLRC